MKKYEGNKENVKWVNTCNKCCSKCMDRHTHLCKKSCFYLTFSCDNCKYQ